MLAFNESVKLIWAHSPGLPGLQTVPGQRVVVSRGHCPPLSAGPESRILRYWRIWWIRLCPPPSCCILIIIIIINHHHHHHNHHHHHHSAPSSSSLTFSLFICNSPKESLRGRIGQITKVVWFQSLADECDQFKAVRPSGLVSNFVSCTICRIAELVPTPLSQCPALCPHHQHSILLICSLETTPPPREQSERRGHSNEETLPVQQKVTDMT